MATTETKSQYRRAGEVSPGIGENLDTILNKDVLLIRYSISERMLNRRAGEQNADEEDDSTTPSGAQLSTIVMLTIALDIDKPDDTKLFHAWSDSLAEKLAPINDEDLPLLIKFMRAPTSSGFKVLTFE